MSSLSVVMPIKAKDQQDINWLKFAIKSVQEQTFKDWDLTIVNDHSEVEFRDKGLIELIKEDDRIKGARLPEGRFGVAHARNYGVEQSDEQAKLLLAMDADDLLPPQAMDIALAAWQGDGIIYGDTELFGQDYQRHHQSREYSYTILLEHLLMPVGSLHSKAAWEKVGGWKSELQIGLEDWEYWIALGKLGVCGHRVPHVLYRYRRHAKGRYAFLRKEPAAYQQAYQQIREIHKDVYGGELPVGCCLGAAKRPSRNKPSAEVVAARQAAAVAQLSPTGLVKLKYTGKKHSFWITGRPSGIRYNVPGPGELLRTADGRQGVDPNDVTYLLRWDVIRPAGG